MFPARILLCSLLSGLATVACGDPPRPPAPQPNPPDVESITGRERLGWNQAASNTAELSTFRYAIYVDGVRSAIAGETCGSTAGAAGFECSAPLPPLTAGRHALELATFIAAAGSSSESPRSSALQVTVVPALSPSESTRPIAGVFTTPAGQRLEATVVAEGLSDPSDLAVLPDGRIAVAERAGRILLIGGGSAREAARLDVRAAGDDDGLMSLAIDPAFERTRQIFVAAYAAPPETALVRVTRYTERAGVFAQAAVILERDAAPRGATAVVRIGPDRRLYLALGTGADPATAQTSGSSFGKIHRFELDGRTPADETPSSPLVSVGHHDPRALAWNPRTTALWEVERDNRSGDEINAIVRGGNFGWPIAKGPAAQPGMTPAAMFLPPHADVAGAVFAPAAFFGSAPTDLLIAGRTIQELFRVRFSADGRQPLGIEPLLNGRFGRLGAVAAGEDAVYISTANRESWGQGRDLLIRLRRPDRD